MSTPDYDSNVFINCPFDSDYTPLFEAMVFTVQDCGYTAHCALEFNDAAQVRMERIFDLIAECRYGIHDLSRVELDQVHTLPRFNMPLELGVFLGARRFGEERQREKACLVLDAEPYRYQKFCSDIAGQDIRSHNGSVTRMVRVVRNWLADLPSSRETRLPSGKMIEARYANFRHRLPTFCRDLRLDPDELIYNDYTTLVAEWLRAHD